jgi:probable F420-dependent oxidoreductase
VKHILSLPTDAVHAVDEFLTARAIGEVAAAAERAGFAGAAVTEHPFPGDEWLRTVDGHHPLDPFVALAFAAAATSTLELFTYLCVLPYRNPFLTAKTALSLHVASGERLRLGAGAGYVESEFRALGIEFATRNERFDEAVVAIRRAWTEDSVAMAGLGFDAPGNTMLPRPASVPPILIGGNSKRAIRRAVECGDGWMPMRYARASGGDRRSAHLDGVDDLRRMLAYAESHRITAGRPWPAGVIVMPLVPANPASRSYDRRRLLDHLADLDDAGVTGVIVAFPGPDRAAVLSLIEQYADEVIRA